MSLQQLQLTQQNLQNILLQKQQIQSQLVEYVSALDNLKDTDKAYKICGKIMIAQPSTVLISNLQEKKETAEVRLKHFEKQEDRLRKNIEELQKGLIADLEKKKK